MKKEKPPDAQPRYEDYLQVTAAEYATLNTALVLLHAYRVLTEHDFQAAQTILRQNFRSNCNALHDYCDRIAQYGPA